MPTSRTSYCKSKGQCIVDIGTYLSRYVLWVYIMWYVNVIIIESVPLRMFIGMVRS